MNVTTYILGAGASANCLPVVNKMADDIEKLKKTLNSSTYIENKSILNEINSILNQLKNICQNNYSVDTYARKLYLSGRQSEYRQLKDNLTLYFTLHQKIYDVDKRYDNFWAAILMDNRQLPDNVRVISWNYDTQLELSFRDFINNSKLSEISSILNMYSIHSKYDYFDQNKFAVFKVNGSAKYKKDHFLKDEFEYLTDDFQFGFYNDIYISDLITNYKKYISFDSNKQSVYKNELSFAWEHDFNSESYGGIRNSLKDTSTLAVIGYSFPIYNRKVDKKIINEFMPNLQKVYLQAPDADGLKERFMELNQNIHKENIIVRTEKEQFVFPNELDI